MPPIIKPKSSLDLDIQGSLGQFRVQSPDSGGSVPVKYIQTHLKFLIDDTNKQRFFENLAPVREIFRTQELSFDDLMQRDIDDARVSNSLIPYLIRIGESDAVKFFPPIVTVVVPIAADGHLIDKYPAVIEDEPEKEGEYEVRRMRSGKRGEEVFQFEQYQVDGQPLEFDNAKLQLNTNKCRLVIVDGQHRAMALLALYRNIKGWKENQRQYENYYKRWSKTALGNIDLAGISLPIVVCTFPLINEAVMNSMTVTKAARAIFLTLNKNARPVSTSRNILLNDYDLIAHFERQVLEHFKDIDPNDPSAMRLWNFELDAEENKTILVSTVAISGVMHVYYLLERALLLANAPSGLRMPLQRFTDKQVQHLHRRLDGNNLLGEDLAKNTTRSAFAPEALATLKESFEKRYTPLLINGFKKFAPYDAMARAALDLEVELKAKLDMQCHAMLFEGQGHLRVFESYVEQLDSELSELYPEAHYPAELSSLLKDFEATATRLEEHKKSFEEARAKKLFSGISPSKITPGMVQAVNQLYRLSLTTQAFQTALFLTFFTTLEKLNDSSRLEGSEKERMLFEEYLNSINAFFRPSDEAGAKRVLVAMVGNITGTFGSQNMKIVDNEYSLRKIVIQRELKPDEWPRFRYVLLELWKTSDDKLDEILTSYIKEARIDVFKSLYTRDLTRFAEQRGIDPTAVKPEKKQKIGNDALDKYLDALEPITQRPLDEAERERLRKAIAEPTISGEDEALEAAPESITPEHSVS